MPRRSPLYGLRPPATPTSSKSILTPHGCQTRGVVNICDHAGAQAKGRRYLRRSHFLRPTPNTLSNCPAASPGLLGNRSLKTQGSGRAAFDLVSTLGFLGHLLLRPIVGRFSVGALQAVIDGAPRGRRPAILLYWRDFFRGSSICARSFTWGARSRFRAPPPTYPHLRGELPSAQFPQAWRRSVGPRGLRPPSSGRSRLRGGALRPLSFQSSPRPRFPRRFRGFRVGRLSPG